MRNNRIKELRDKYRLTQREMAEKLNISVDYVSMLERGIRTPGFILAKRIADLFNCKVDDIFFSNIDYKMSDNDDQTSKTA